MLYEHNCYLYTLFESQERTNASTKATLLCLKAVFLIEVINIILASSYCYCTSICVLMYQNFMMKRIVFTAM